MCIELSSSPLPASRQLRPSNGRIFIQIASFHPNYRFAETQENDVTNYTNRSPFPMLHLIRESEVEQAVTTYPEVEKIPARNMELLEQLGEKGFKALQQKWQRE